MAVAGAPSTRRMLLEIAVPAVIALTPVFFLVCKKKMRQVFHGQHQEDE